MPFRLRVSGRFCTNLTDRPCSGAHHWARLFMEHGHTVRLIAPKFVAPYRLSGKTGKDDAADAAAICEAVQRPNMRFVPIKNLNQQGQLSVHRVRQGYIEERTATINRIRGLLSEFGIVLPLKAATVRREAMACLEDLPGWMNTVIGDLLSEVHHLDEKVAEYDKHLSQMAREDSRVQQLMLLPGVGTTTATAMFVNDRQWTRIRMRPPVLSLAWIGAQPAQFRRQIAIGTHHQSGRPLHAFPVGAGRTLSPARFQRKDR